MLIPPPSSADGRKYLEREVPCVPAIGFGRCCEDVKISRAEDKCVEDLGDEGDTCLGQPLNQGNKLRAANSPSALLFAWIAHIRIIFEDVCEMSPRMWNTLNPLIVHARDKCTARMPRAGAFTEVLVGLPIVQVGWDGMGWNGGCGCGRRVPNR